MTLSPRIPLAEEEEDMLPPRICVAPTILQCIMGITGFGKKSATEWTKENTYYVYFTDNSGYVEAKETLDYYRTSEKYFTEETIFEYCKTSPLIIC